MITKMVVLVLIKMLGTVHDHKTRNSVRTNLRSFFVCNMYRTHYRNIQILLKTKLFSDLVNIR
jgi:hypothetical protein